MNIPLGTSTTATITGYVSGFISDFSGYISLIIGILFAIFILHVIIDLIRGNSGTRKFESTASGDLSFGGRGRRVNSANVARSFELEGLTEDEAREETNRLLEN